MIVCFVFLRGKAELDLWPEGLAFSKVRLSRKTQAPYHLIVYT